MMSARTGCRAGEALWLADGMSALMMGSAKPAVFPVPVWAAAITSWPAMTTGMALAWMGVGLV